MRDELPFKSSRTYTGLSPFSSGTIDRVHHLQLTRTTSVNKPIVCLYSGADEGIFPSCQRPNKRFKPVNGDPAYCTLLCLFPSSAFIKRLRVLERAKERMQLPFQLLGRLRLLLLFNRYRIVWETSSCEEAGKKSEWEGLSHREMGDFKQALYYL